MEPKENGFSGAAGFDVSNNEQRGVLDAEVVVVVVVYGERGETSGLFLRRTFLQRFSGLAG